MTIEYLQLGATAVVAIAGFKALEYVTALAFKKNGKTEHLLCPQVISLSALFEAAEKGRTEKDAIIHNGLNTNANAVKELASELNKNTIAIEKIATIIDERIPRKQ